MDFEQLLIVSIGAICGSCIRFYLLEKLNFLFSYKPWRTAFVNTIASFGLGLFLAIHQRLLVDLNNSQTFLFIGTGLFGSMSTFSTLIVEVLESLLSLKLIKGFLYLLLTIILGLLAVALGFKMANAKLF